MQAVEEKALDYRYSIEQLQAFDFLLKKITSTSSYAFYQRNLKLVIEFNNVFWYGDFIQFEKQHVYQSFISDQGNVVVDKFDTSNGSGFIAFKCAFDAFNTHNKQGSKYWSDPFKEMDSLPLLLDTLIKLIKLANIPQPSSPFYQYLLHAKSIDGKLKLPFINLTGERIKLISLVEVEK